MKATKATSGSLPPSEGEGGGSTGGGVPVSRRATLAGLIAVAAAPAATAPQAAAGATGADYKCATPTPPGVEMPDTPQTRFGTLNFLGGFPDKASTEKLHDNLDFQRAVQGYLLGLPVASQVANRAAILGVGPANLTVPI